jgi:class 3 adenylate cyclase
METKNLTIMLTDLVDYTSKTSHIPRKKFLELLDTYEKLIEPIFEEFDGKLVKKIGDAFMAAFESPTNAILCGVKIQYTLFNHNQNLDKKDQIHVRVAINTGEVHLREDDIYGEAVNIASRLEEKAKPDDIYFTDSVFLSMNKAEIPSILIGKRPFKGIPRKVGVYKVLGEYSKILLARKKKKRKIKKTIIGSILIIFSIIILALMFILLSEAFGINILP